MLAVEACSEAIAQTQTIADIAVMTGAAGSDSHMGHSAGGVTRVDGARVTIVDDEGRSRDAHAGIIAGFIAVAHVAIGATGSRSQGSMKDPGRGRKSLRCKRSLFARLRPRRFPAHRT
jgi:hypothetical protein